MVSKNKIKFIRSLELKKNRLAQRLFVAEGPKVVGDIMARQQAETVVCTAEWMNGHTGSINAKEVVEATEEELQKISFLKHPQQVLAVFPFMDSRHEEPPCIGRLSIALDNVQDPGNLGTIIRIADWFGIETIYCSAGTADAYNPKVVQATMGSIARVDVVYTDLCQLIESLPEGFPVYGTFLDGNSIYKEQLSAEGILLMGNEGNGISPETARLVSHRLLIPNFPAGRETADSLNVAIATAIACSEFRRNQ